MKNVRMKFTGAALIALAASLTLSHQANAIVLAYETDPDGAGPLTIGSPYSGPINFKFIAFDNGTTYGTPTPTTGYSGAPNVAAVIGGINAVNAVPGQTPAGNAFAGIVSPGSLEDGWAVGRITNIQDLAGNDLWTPGGKGVELTALLRGEQDFHIQADPSNPANQTIISGVGFRVNLYEDGIPGPPLDPATPFNPTLGPAGRTTATNYTTATDGTLVLSLGSTAGFIHTDVGGPAPGFGGSATEYENNFNLGSLSGLGTAFFNVIGGTQAGMFDTNSVSSAASLFNAGLGLIPTPFTDFKANFTITAGQFNFLVTANDPLQGLVIPEPTAALGGFACIAPVIGATLGRRRKSVPKTLKR